MTMMGAEAFISLGGTGILAYIMWQFASRFLKALELQVEARIAALEKRCEQCESDRLALHLKLESILERNARIDVAREALHTKSTNL